MSSSRELVTIAIVFAGIVLAVVGPRAVHTDAVALAVIGVGLALAALSPVALFGVDTLLNGTGGDIERAVDYRSNTVAWYATMVVLLATTLSLEYLPPWLATETLLWGRLSLQCWGKQPRVSTSNGRSPGDRVRRSSLSRRFARRRTVPRSPRE